MRISTIAPFIIAVALTVPALASRLSTVRPHIFAPGVITGSSDDGAATFAPDESVVYFMRGNGNASTVMESQHRNGHWTIPRPASFSGQWRDLDPSMAPDGSFLLFVSNRPKQPGGEAIDALHAGKRYKGLGMNIWRINRRNGQWSAPVRLPDRINSCSMTFAPSVAADHSIYFIGCSGPHRNLQLLHAAYIHGRYDKPSVVKFDVTDGQAQGSMIIRDPAIAADGSFMVFSVKHDRKGPYRLAITFHTVQGWSAPQSLGPAVNDGAQNMGSQIGPDQHTLYFYSDRRLPASNPYVSAAWNNGSDHIWYVSLTPWLEMHAHE